MNAHRSVSYSSSVIKCCVVLLSQCRAGKTYVLEHVFRFLRLFRVLIRPDTKFRPGNNI